MILRKRWVLTWNACAGKQQQALYLSANAVFYVCTAYVAVETEKKSQIAFTAVVFLFLCCRAEQSTPKMNAQLGCTKRSPPPPDLQVKKSGLVFLRVLQNILKPVVWQMKLSMTLCSSTHSTFELVNNTRLRSSTPCCICYFCAFEWLQVACSEFARPKADSPPCAFTALFIHATDESVAPQGTLASLCEHSLLWEHMEGGKHKTIAFNVAVEVAATGARLRAWSDTVAGSLGETSSPLILGD